MAGGASSISNASNTKGAVDYTIKRPRYQPFEVVSVPSGRQILRSSGSEDFVWEMFQDLADLYVGIDPLLIPPRGKLQFYVADPQRDNDDGRRDDEVDPTKKSSDESIAEKHPGLNPNVKQVKGAVEGTRAALFYESFFNCANAIRTGDYSLYLPPTTDAPTATPTVSVAPTQGNSQIVNQPSRAPSSLANLNETIPIQDETLSGGDKPNAPGVSGDVERTEVEDEDSFRVDHDMGSPTDGSLTTNQLAPANDATESPANETGINARLVVRLLSRNETEPINEAEPINETESIDSMTNVPEKPATNEALQSEGVALIADNIDEANVEGDELEEIKEVLEEIEDAIEEMEEELDSETQIPNSEDDLSLAAEEAAIEAEELAIKAAEATLANTTSEVCKELCSVVSADNRI